MPMTDSPEHLANRLKNWRRLNGIKQEALAQLMGVSQSTVSFWENGHEKPSQKHALELRKLISKTMKDEITIERLFIKRQMAIRALCDFDGIVMLESSEGFKSLWPETATLENRMMIDTLINEPRDFILNHDNAKDIRKGEIALVSGISQRITNIKLDDAIKCRWHLCFRKYGYKTILDVVFEPCDDSLDDGIIDIHYI